jgi:hypothetical protein
LALEVIVCVTAVAGVRSIASWIAARIAAFGQGWAERRARSKLYSSLDSYERSVLSLFIDRGVSVLSVDDAYGLGAAGEERTNFIQAVKRLSHRKFVDIWPDQYWEHGGDRFALRAKHFGVLSASPKLIGSATRARVVDD